MLRPIQHLDKGFLIKFSFCVSNTKTAELSVSSRVTVGSVHQMTEVALKKITLEKEAA